MQKQVQKEREVWRQREQTLSAVIQEKEELLHYQKEVLESCQKDVQVRELSLQILSKWMVKTHPV